MKQKQGLCAYRVIKAEHLYSPSCQEGFFSETGLPIHHSKISSPTFSQLMCRNRPRGLCMKILGHLVSFPCPSNN